MPRTRKRIIQEAQRKEIKIRTEINEIQTKKTVVKINKTKNWFFENKIDKP